MKLSDRNWKSFYLSNLFEINSTKSGIDKNKLNNKNGKFPYVTRTYKNNGIECFIDIQEKKYNFEYSNVIIIGLDTQTVFYQPHTFFTGQNIQVLYNKNLNKYTALFLLPPIKLLLKKFSWGSNGATLTRLKNSSIFLPINLSGEPDYEFMEAYMREKEEKLKSQYKKFIYSRLQKKHSKPQEPKEWKEFKINNIFDVNKGIYLPSSAIKEGKTPYITAKNGENGINRFIGNCPLFPGNILTIEKVNFTTYYQPSPFYCSHDVSAISNKNINRYIALYLCFILNRNSIKYSYGRQAQMNVVKRETIFLPVTSLGKPDYEYMENYMKYLEQQKLKKYSEYL